ncbi:MAG: energy transducer TonB, partial [Inhella sp.]
AEAAQRETEAAARQGPGPRGALPHAWSTARRYRLFGRSDPNPEIQQYAEAWARKIHLNTPVELVRELAAQPHQAPLVTVAIRRDGTVETVTLVSGSGVAAVDEAVRRVVQMHQPFQAFPPGMAAEIDVIEIRRSWYFSNALWLQ